MISQNLFVYGTLLFPELLSKLTGKEFMSQSAILENYRRYSIYDNDVPRSYPAIAKEKGQHVEGRILFNVDKESIELIDLYEGAEYNKNSLPIRVADSICFARVYTWKESLRYKLKFEWDIESFKKDYYNLYLRKVIPGSLEEFKLNKRY